MTYFGISTNLISYLTKVQHQDLKTAAKNVNYWVGVTAILPLFGGYLADAYTGRFSMIMFSSFVYLAGLILLTMSEFIPSLKPCNVKGCTHPRKVHQIAFFLGIYLLSLGTSGHKPCLESFGADQFDDDHLEERKRKMSFFNWWNFTLCAGLLLGATLIVYVQDQASWGIASLSLTVTMGVAVILFYLGKTYYRYQMPEGSIFTPMLQVLVAAITKRNLPHPSAPNLLYEIPKSQNRGRGRFLCHTNNLRFLDKAAIVEGCDIQDSERQQISWNLATITMVEETKLIIRTIPVWFTSLIFGVCLAEQTTFFVKQSYTMDRRIGRSFEVPAATVNCLSAIGMLLTIFLYEKLLIPRLRRATGNERGLNILKRIGVGMIFPIVGMSIAALVEKKRIRIAKNEIAHGGRPEALPMSALWLVPQCVAMGVGEALSLVGLQEYFYDQVPDSMRSLGMALYLSVIGAGSFINSFIVTVVGHITDKWGTSWFRKDLNSSRLDKFYWFVAAVGWFNFCAYLFLARGYSYKNVNKNVDADPPIPFHLTSSVS